MSEENRYQIDDVEITVEGSGQETIVMIHGWPDTASMWDPQVDAFKSKYRCVRFTLPGFDPKHERRIRSLDEMISFINQVVVLVSPGEKVILLVHDWGCLFGYQFCNQHPDKVSKIIGVDIGDTVSWIANVPLFHQLAANAYQSVLAACWKLGGKLGDAGTRRVAKFFNYPGNIVLKVPIADLDGLLTFGLIDLVSLFFQSWLRVKITHLGLNFISSAFTISRPTLENGKLDTKS